MPTVKKFDVHKAKQELKSCPKIVRDYVKLLEENNQRWKELKRIYRIYFGRPDTEKVTKSDIENWVGGMAQADIEAADSTNN